MSLHKIQITTVLISLHFEHSDAQTSFIISNLSQEMFGNMQKTCDVHENIRGEDPMKASDLPEHHPRMFLRFFGRG